MALRTEQRLLALRRKMEEGNHKYNKGIVLPPSCLDLDDSLTIPATVGSFDMPPMPLNDCAVATPRVTLEESAPLKTPPTPGRKRRFLCSSGVSCPRFLPLGMAAHQRPLASLPPTASSAVPEKTTGSNPSSFFASGDVGDTGGKRFRVNPRFDSPWLAGYAISAPPLSDPAWLPVASVEFLRPESKALSSALSRHHFPDSEMSTSDAVILSKIQTTFARKIDTNDVTAGHIVSTDAAPSPLMPGGHQQGPYACLSRQGNVNHHPNEVRVRALSLSHGFGTTNASPALGSSPENRHGTLVERFSVLDSSIHARRSLSLNMLQSNLSLNNQHTKYSDHSALKSCHSDDTGRKVSHDSVPSKSSSASQPRSDEAKSVDGAAEGTDSKSGSRNVPIPGQFPETTERVFRAAMA